MTISNAIAVRLANNESVQNNAFPLPFLELCREAMPHWNSFPRWFSNHEPRVVVNFTASQAGPRNGSEAVIGVL